MEIEGTKIEKIGFWKEYTLYPDDNSVHDLVFNEKQPNKKEILEYLDSGVRVLLTRGVNECKLHGNIFAPYGKVFFDGKWLWSEGFVYYFKKYNLEIPQRFLEHIEKNNFTIPIKKEDMSEALFEKISALASSLIYFRSQ